MATAGSPDSRSRSWLSPDAQESIIQSLGDPFEESYCWMRVAEELGEERTRFSGTLESRPIHQKEVKGRRTL